MKYKEIAEVENFDVGGLFHSREMVLEEAFGELIVEGGDWVMASESTKYAPNTPLILSGLNARGVKGSALGIVKKDKLVLVEDVYHPCTIRPKDVAQTFALGMLRDSDIDLVLLTGEAGSGKTLLALAHALQMARSNTISKVILTKPLVPIGREIGYLKGDYMEKLRPWLGNFYDNMQVLGISDAQITGMIEPNAEYEKRGGVKLEISPITYMQGRSISDAVMIIDEAQNLSKEVIKQILTRPAENTKVIMLGDPGQIFEKVIDEENNGLLWAVKQGEKEDFVGHVHLTKVQRSRLAAWAAKL